MSKIEELRIKAESAIKEINMAIADNKHSEIILARTSAKTAVDELNSEIVNDMFAEFLADENPMLKALEKCYYTVYSIKSSIDKDTKIETAELSDKLEIVDIKALEDTAKTAISVNGQWRYAVEKMAFLLACRVEKDLNLNSNLISTYKMSQVAKDFDLKGTFTSNTQILSALNSILAMIIPNATGLTCDVKFMTYLMVKRGKEGLSVKLPQQKTIQKLITEIAHRIITKSSYTSEYETVSKKG